MWKPFLVGCLLMGLVTGLVGAAAIHTLWRIHVVHRWRKRQQERALRDNTGR